MNEPLTILCPSCHQPLPRIDLVEQTAQGPRLDFYQCATEHCGGKLGVIFELSGDHAAQEPGFVEREVARRGAFFPTDYRTAGHGPRNW